MLCTHSQVKIRRPDHKQNLQPVPVRFIISSPVENLTFHNFVTHGFRIFNFPLISKTNIFCILFFFFFIFFASWSEWRYVLIGILDCTAASIWYESFFITSKKNSSGKELWTVMLQGLNKKFLQSIPQACACLCGVRLVSYSFVSNKIHLMAQLPLSVCFN